MSADVNNSTMYLKCDSPDLSTSSADNEEFHTPSKLKNETFHDMKDKICLDFTSTKDAAVEDDYYCEIADKSCHTPKPDISVTESSNLKSHNNIEEEIPGESDDNTEGSDIVELIECDKLESSLYQNNPLKNVESKLEVIDSAQVTSTNKHYVMQEIAPSKIKVFIILLLKPLLLKILFLLVIYCNVGLNPPFILFISTPSNVVSYHRFILTMFTQ